jgi:hypothetical protein
LKSRSSRKGSVSFHLSRLERDLKRLSKTKPEDIDGSVFRLPKSGVDIKRLPLQSQYSKMYPNPKTSLLLKNQILNGKLSADQVLEAKPETKPNQP